MGEACSRRCPVKACDPHTCDIGVSHAGFEIMVEKSGWPEMRQKVRDAITEIDTATPFVDTEELSESKDFLRWIEDHQTKSHLKEAA